MAAGAPATATVAPTTAPSGADDDPAENDGYEDRDLAPTPSSTSSPSPPTAAPTLERSWAGANLLSLTLAGVWTDSTYSLYLKEGGETYPVGVRVCLRLCLRLCLCVYARVCA